MKDYNTEELNRYLEEKNKEIQHCSNLRIEAITTHKNYMSQYKAEAEKLKAKGINDPKELPTYIDNLKKEIQTTLEEIDLLLPKDMLDLYKNKSLDQLLDEAELKNMNLSQNF